jgi:hypothetical protein
LILSVKIVLYNTICRIVYPSHPDERFRRFVVDENSSGSTSTFADLNWSPSVGGTETIGLSSDSDDSEVPVAPMSEAGSRRPKFQLTIGKRKPKKSTSAPKSSANRNQS